MTRFFIQQTWNKVDVLNFRTVVFILVDKNTSAVQCQDFLNISYQSDENSSSLYVRRFVNAWDSRTWGNFKRKNILFLSVFFLFHYKFFFLSYFSSFLFSIKEQKPLQIAKNLSLCHQTVNIPGIWYRLHWNYPTAKSPV